MENQIIPQMFVQVNLNVAEHDFDLDKLNEKLWWACYKDDDGISPEERVFIVSVFHELAKKWKTPQPNI